MKNTVFLLAFLAILVPLSLKAQAPENQIKAEFIERFTRFIDWPSDYEPAGYEEAFVIAVIGDSEIKTFLVEIAERQKIKEKQVEIIVVDSPEDLVECHILFVAGSESRNLSRILNWTRDLPILTVADSDGFGEKGVLVNFFREDKFLRFEVNRPAVERSGLRFSSKLLRLAKILDTGDGP